MRSHLVLLMLLSTASPALAQSVPSPVSEIERALADPATADRMAQSMQALSNAFLNLPVGEVQAAIEGRQPTPQDRKRTVGDMARRDNPGFDRDFRRQIANAKPTIVQSMNALSSALPGMIRGVEQMQRSLKRATANMPDPTYPKR